MAILDTVTAALEFRDKNDPVIKQFEEMKRSVELLRARLGDALIPVIQAVAVALGPVIEGLSEWLGENRKLIASGILRFLIGFAKVLNTAIGGAILLVAKAWTGWQLLINATKLSLAAFAAVALKSVEAILGGFRAVAELAGQEGLAQQIGEAETAVGSLGESFRETAAEAVDEMFKVQGAYDDLEKKVEDVTKTINEVANEAWVRGQEIIQDSIAGTTRTLEEQEAAAAKAAEAAAERARAAQELADARAKAEQERLRAETKAFEEAEKAKLAAAAEQMAARQAMAERVGDTFRRLTETIVQGYIDQQGAGEEAAEETRKATIMAVLDIITAFAAEAAAAIFAKTIEALGFPAGPIAGAALGAATAAAILALKAGVAASFAEGGFVRGGVPGRDTVPILAQEGEFVMSQSDVRGFRKFASKILGASSGNQLADVSRGVDQARTQAGNLIEKTTIVNRMWFPARVEESRMSIRQARSRARLRDLGALPTGG